MAHIEKRNGRWRARYRDPAGAEKSRTFDKKATAQQWLDGVMGDQARGVYIDPRGAKVTFKEFAETWRRGREGIHRGSTAYAVAGRLTNHIYPAFGSRALGTIRPSEIQGWVAMLSTTLAPGSVENCYRLLATVFRAAVTDRLIPSSPCVGIKLPAAPRAKVVPLPVEAIVAIRDGMPARLQAAVTLAAGAGLRMGETLGITTDRIDWLRRTVTVDRQMVTPAEGRPHLAPPKTASSVRTVPLPRVVVDALAAHVAAFPVAEDGGWAGLLFTTGTGQPWRRSAVTAAWRKAADATPWAGSTFHATRHHCASVLIAAGCSVRVVQNQLGHANASETLNVYSHLWPQDDQRVRDAIDAAFGLPQDEPAAVSL